MSREPPGRLFLSEHQPLAEVNLEHLLRAAAAAAWRTPTAPPPAAVTAHHSSQHITSTSGSSSCSASGLEAAALRLLDTSTVVNACADGRCDAAALWLELESPGGGCIATANSGLETPTTGISSSRSSCGSGGSSSNGSSSGSRNGSSSKGCHSACVRGGSRQGCKDAAIEGSCVGTTAKQTSSSIKQALSYLRAPVALVTGQKAVLRLQPAQEGTSLSVTLTQLPPSAAAAKGEGVHWQGSECQEGGGVGLLKGAEATLGPLGWPRHALLPSWHWTMLADEARNSKYDEALR